MYLCIFDPCVATYSVDHKVLEILEILDYFTSPSDIMTPFSIVSSPIIYYTFFFSLFPKLYLIFLFSSSFPFKNSSKLLLRVIPFSLHYHSLYYHCYVTPQFTSIFLCFLLSHYISKIQFYLFTLLKQNNDTFYMNIFLNHFFFCIYIHPWNLLWHALDFGSAYLAL